MRTHMVTTTYKKKLVSGFERLCVNEFGVQEYLLSSNREERNLFGIFTASQLSSL